MSSALKETSAIEQVDAIIKSTRDWRGKTLADLRVIITNADRDIVEEVKWKMPSKPTGIPVWSNNGIICFCNKLKNAVRLTFPKGAQINDPDKLFNTRLDSKTVRAIDFFESGYINATALQNIVREIIRLNLSNSSN